MSAAGRKNLLRIIRRCDSRCDQTIAQIVNTINAILHPMINPLTFFICLFTLPALLPFQAAARQMPLPYSPVTDERMTADWLIAPVKQKAAIYYSADKKNIILYNGLVRRVFSLTPGLACVDYKNMSNGQQLLRAIQPEAKIEINKVEYKVGGLYGQQQNAYLLPQ